MKDLRRKRPYDSMRSSQSSDGSSHKAPRLESITLDSSPGDQAEIDRRVLRESTLAPFRQYGFQAAFLTVLLSAIVDASPKLEQTYINPKEAYKLINGYHDLTGMLEKSWEQKSFASICSLREHTPALLSQ